MTNQDSQVIDLVEGMFRELSADLREARAEAKRDHTAQIEAQAKLDKKVSEALRWQDEHNKHHGKNDVAIAARIEAIAGVKHDEAVAAAAVKEYKKRFSWITNLGLDAVKTVAMFGVGSGLVGIGWLVGRLF